MNLCIYACTYAQYTDDCIMIDGHFCGFEWFSSSKLVLQTVECGAGMYVQVRVCVYA